MTPNQIVLRAAAFAIALTAGLPAQAQDATSREIVQPLPSPQVQRLNAALLELARQPESVSTLVEAGNASLAVGDVEAALGFYRRASELDPADAKVKLGLGRAYLRSGRALDAIPSFNAALVAGTPARELLSDQALAFDLIGDQPSAQVAYARAIELNPQDNEARRRLAISQAISDNQAGFQSTLAPMIERGDNAAFRARAFGLAILGEQERAEAIVDSVMPRDLASRINPYLAYMPRLTPAQQAAAANLGIFPRVGDIGREDPRLARFAREGSAGSLLEPTGEPLGNASPARQSREVAQPLPDTRTGPEPASVDSVFADLGEGELPVEGNASEAVDLGQIDIPREAPPEPAEPEHPRRIWVQLATGRDVRALGFDWRRFVRQAPELLGEFEPYVTPWGQANRLLAGPLEDRAEARALVNALAQKGLNTFAYTSPEGTEIQKLN